MCTRTELTFVRLNLDADILDEQAKREGEDGKGDDAANGDAAELPADAGHDDDGDGDVDDRADHHGDVGAQSILHDLDVAGDA